MGSGLSLEEFLLTQRATEFEKSWMNQSRELRRPRIQYINQLAVLHDYHMKNHDRGATMAYDIAIEAVIEGRPDDLETALFLTDFPREEDPDGSRKKAFEPLRKLIAEIRVVLENEVNLRKKFLDEEKAS